MSSGIISGDGRAGSRTRTRAVHTKLIEIQFSLTTEYEASHGVYLEPNSLALLSNVELHIV